ncbi:hypothetical protein ACVXG7_13815 [Enterobacter hormaechei]
MVSCNLAFIDCKLPGSHLKQNYSFIGPGVTQSSEQVVNIPEPHGFNIGAAAMPKGVTNNLHLHFTAEVFPIHEGTCFRWGANGEHEAEFSAPTILSIRPGFSAVSPTSVKKIPAAWYLPCSAGQHGRHHLAPVSAGGRQRVRYVSQQG